jgi:predicted nucleic acid-binding Zn ribbon protein
MSAVDPTRTCERCGGPIPASARSHAMFCSGRCKVAAYRARQTVTPEVAKPRTVTEQTVTEPAPANKTVTPDQTVTAVEIGEPETVTDDLAAIMLNPILSDPYWHGMPIRPGGLSDVEWAGTLRREISDRLARASLKTAKGALAGTLIARAA